MYNNMPARNILTGFLCVFCAVLFLNSGCSKKETETETEYINALFMCWISDYSQYGILCSDPIADPDGSVLTITRDTVSLTFPYETIYVGYIYFGAEFYLEIAQEYALSMSSDVGDCEGTATIPAPAQIMTPAPGSMLQLGQNISCTWAPSTGADFYWVGYYAYAYNVNGYYLGYFEEDTFVSNTTLTIAATKFNIPNAVYYEVELFVEPYSGSPPLPGASGNMTGSIKGFANAVGEYDYTYFAVSSVSDRTPKGNIAEIPPMEERIKSYLKHAQIDCFSE